MTGLHVGRYLAALGIGATLVVSPGCRPQAAAQTAPESLAGDWTITQMAGGPMQFGILLRYLGDGRLGGEIRRILSGNMELDVSEYSPVMGAVNDNRVRLESQVEGETLRFDLVMEADSVRVVSINWLGRELVSDDWRWSARRES